MKRFGKMVIVDDWRGKITVSKKYQKKRSNNIFFEIIVVAIIIMATIFTTSFLITYLSY